MSWRDLYRFAVSHADATAVLTDYTDRAVIGSGNAALHRGALMCLNTATSLDPSVTPSVIATYTLCRMLDAHSVAVPADAMQRIGKLRRL